MEQIKTYSFLSDDMIHLRVEVFVEEQGIPMELEIEENEDKFIHCCIYDEDKLIAYARVKEGHIGRVCVKKKYRHLGYGRKIVLFAEKQISSKEIQIHAQVQAEQFYMSLGYKTYGEPFMEDGIEHKYMKKVRF
ncbi:MAG: GNAT family N-acetyltransferase [Anaeroplasmataceae bacterium]|nr:GNAT family N-acetyltransferase [Anaeroplasmataceae bacterium]